MTGPGLVLDAAVRFAAFGSSSLRVVAEEASEPRHPTQGRTDGRKSAGVILFILSLPQPRRFPIVKSSLTLSGKRDDLTGRAPASAVSAGTISASMPPIFAINALSS